MEKTPPFIFYSRLVITILSLALTSVSVIQVFTSNFILSAIFSKITSFILFSGILLVMLIWWIVELEVQRYHWINATPALFIYDYRVEDEKIFLVEENELTWNSTSPTTELRYDARYENIVSRGKKDIQYLSVIIINDPKIRNGNTAKSVWASIEFINKESGKILEWIGRWEGISPNTLDIREDKRMLDTVDIKPNNYPQNLRIAFKDKSGNLFFGLANANYKYGDWKDPILKMNQGKYIAKITLKGEQYWCLLFRI